MTAHDIFTYAWFEMPIYYWPLVGLTGYGLKRTFNYLFGSNKPKNNLIGSGGGDLKPFKDLLDGRKVRP